MYIVLKLVKRQLMAIPHPPNQQVYTIPRAPRYHLRIAPHIANTRHTLVPGQKSYDSRAHAVNPDILLHKRATYIIYTPLLFRAAVVAVAIYTICIWYHMYHIGRERDCNIQPARTTHTCTHIQSNICCPHTHIHTHNRRFDNYFNWKNDRERCWTGHDRVRCAQLNRNSGARAIRSKRNKVRSWASKTQTLHICIYQRTGNRISYSI